jgi:hypothetical protein
LADITTIAELGTAGGTLVLAIATFGATRSANRTARIAERSLLVGLRPTLVTSRPEDRTERVDFGQGARALDVPGGSGVISDEEGMLFMAIALRNIGAGPAVLRGWHVRRGRERAEEHPVDRDQFRAQRRDLFIAPGDTGFWQGAVRDADDPLQEEIRAGVQAGDPITFHLLYTDQEDVQAFVSRFVLVPEDSGWTALVGRHWTLES